MTQITSAPTCENNLGRKVVETLSTVIPKATKRFSQSKLNKSFKITETSLTQDIKDYFAKTDLKLKDIKIYHSSSHLSKSLPIARFSNHANGLTLLVLYFENYQPLFQFVVCSLKDNFSRLEGRVYVKRRALHALKEKGIEGLLTYPTPPEFVQSINALKIGNWVVKNYIIPEKEKKPIYINKLKYQNEETLLAMAKEVLATRYDVDPTTFRLHTQYIRFYSTNLFSHGLVCSPEWFKTLQQEGKQLIANGGYTVYSMNAKKKETDEKLVFITFATCSKEEAFVKSYGRKQALINFIKDHLKAHPYNRPVENMKEALINYAERELSHAINVEISSDKETYPFS